MLSWKAPPGAPPAGYKIYWRRTTSPTWDHWAWVGNATERTMEGLIIDNYLFGVASVGENGNESPVVFHEPSR